MWMHNVVTQLAMVALVTSWAVAAEDEPADLPLLLQEDFEQGSERWQPTDPLGWKVTTTGGKSVFSQFLKKSNYQPPQRSPFNIALLKDVTVSDFILDAKVLSTHEDYGHRDACVVFGYQDAAHFYYVHLGKQADDHANQIFIVNDAPRTKISITSTAGTNWDDQWHHVRILRRVSDGAIEIYFDNLETPVMTAKDKTFTWGRIGVGSFDDTTDWDDIELQGQIASKP